MTTATYAPTAPVVATNPQLSPYGLFGDLARTMAPVAGQALGSVFGNQQIGGQIGNTLGSIASLLPFSVQPGVPPVAAQYPQYQYPQHQAALAQAAAQNAVAQQAAAQIAVAQQAAAQNAVARALQPIPIQQAQLAPYGIVGDLVRAVAPIATQQLIPNPQTANEVNQILGSVANLLPFSAQPQQLNPYGFIGGALGNIVGGLGGSAIGGLFGNPSTGNAIGSTAGSVLGAILPFQATPSPWMAHPVMPYQQPMWN
jgi:outer membrane lipoprotein SlyB